MNENYRQPAMPDGAVEERRVRHLDANRVAAADRVDVRERREVRRPVARDVDEPVLAGHEGAEIAARPLFEGLMVGAVDEDHVHAHPWNANAADRLAAA